MRPDIPDEQEMNAYEAYPRRGIIPVGGPRLAPIHDRTLGTMMGLLGAVAVSRHLVTIGSDPISAVAIGLYLPAGMLGYTLGMKCPPEYRGALQAAATAALSLVGANTFGSL